MAYKNISQSALMQKGKKKEKVPINYWRTNTQESVQNNCLSNNLMNLLYLDMISGFSGLLIMQLHVFITTVSSSREYQTSLVSYPALSMTCFAALRSPHLRQKNNTAHTGCPSSSPSCMREQHDPGHIWNCCIRWPSQQASTTEQEHYQTADT